MKHPAARSILILYFLFDQALCRFLLFPLMRASFSDDAYHSLALVIRLLLLCAILFLWLPHGVKETRIDRRTLPNGIRCVLLSVLAMVCIQSAAVFVLKEIGAVSANQIYVNTLQSEDLFRALFEGLIYAPLCEEIVFRDTLISEINALIHPKAGVLLSGVLFGLLHFAGASLTQFVFIPLYALCGYILALCHRRSGSLVYAMGAHFILNLLAMLV
ncbi:MAG: CPBP family intramembrane metalloprotease [Solobacterium sp.]|nr:CPBP family intramembrane metalloprotease [Solobacterium sp.]